MKRTRTLALLVAMVIGALPLWAQDLNHNANARIYRDGNTWVEETTGTMTAPAALRVNTDIGSISVQGGPQKDVTYTIRKRVHSDSEESARRAFSGFRITAANRAGQLVIEGNSERRYGRLTVEFQFQVPRDLPQVRADTDGGSLSFNNLAGRVAAQSGGGSISLSDIAGEITADTGGGTIEATNSSNLNLRTGGGSIKIMGSKGNVNASTGGGSISVGGALQAVTVSTGGGSVHVQQCGSELSVSTGGGSINVGDVSGKAKLDTGGGSIKLTSARGPVIANTGGGSIELWKLMQGARAQTGAGSITAEFLGTSASDSTLQTSVGDIIVYIAPQVKMTVKATLDMANGHQIRSEFPGLTITSSGGEYGPKSFYAQGSLNGGGPLLKVQTMSSNIEFRRAK